MSGPICLIFHGVGTPKRELEKDEAPYWVSQDRFERILDRIANAPRPSDYIITFDDGNLSDREIALPCLKDRGLKARFFVLSGRLGHGGSLGQDDLRELLDAGMTVGSHGIAHLPWPTLSDDALRNEVENSRQVLQTACETEITEVGIPFGRYDKRILSALRSAGYVTAWSSDGGHMGSHPFLRARTSVRGDMTCDQLDDVLAGRMPMVKRIRRAIGMTKRRYFTTS